MNPFILTKEEYAKIAYNQAKRAFNDALPEALRKARQKEWLDTSDVMEILDCSRRHVQQLRDTNQIVFYQQGRSIRYRYEDIIEYLNRGKVAGGN